MLTGQMRDTVTFQRTDNKKNYSDVYTCRAYINGVSGSEWFIANAGFDAGLTVTITVRYCAEVMSINPNVCRAVDGYGNVYELLSPGDDKQAQHREVIFRARRKASGKA